MTGALSKNPHCFSLMARWASCVVAKRTCGPGTVCNSTEQQGWAMWCCHIRHAREAHPHRAQGCQTPAFVQTSSHNAAIGSHGCHMPPYQ